MPRVARPGSGKNKRPSRVSGTRCASEMETLIFGQVEESKGRKPTLGRGKNGGGVVSRQSAVKKRNERQKEAGMTTMTTTMGGKKHEFSGPLETAGSCDLIAVTFRKYAETGC